MAQEIHKSSSRVQQARVRSKASALVSTHTTLRVAGRAVVSRASVPCSTPERTLPVRLWNQRGAALFAGSAYKVRWRGTAIRCAARWSYGALVLSAQPGIRSVAVRTHL